jgi:hypothetical protein
MFSKDKSNHMVPAAKQELAFMDRDIAAAFAEGDYEVGTPSLIQIARYLKASVEGSLPGDSAAMEAAKEQAAAATKKAEAAVAEREEAITAMKEAEAKWREAEEKALESAKSAEEYREAYQKLEAEMAASKTTEPEQPEPDDPGE